MGHDQTKAPGSMPGSMPGCTISAESTAALAASRVASVRFGSFCSLRIVSLPQKWLIRRFGLLFAEVLNRNSEVHDSTLGPEEAYEQPRNYNDLYFSWVKESHLAQ